MRRQRLEVSADLVAGVAVGGDAVAGLYVLTIVVPPFLADENPATQHYLDLFEEYLPDGKSEAILGYNSFSAWLLFATAVGECGSDVTRTCVFEAAKEIGNYADVPVMPIASQ